MNNDGGAGLSLPKTVAGAEETGNSNGKAENTPAVKAVHPARPSFSSEVKSRSVEIRN
jgi:hypothetical protein